MTVGRQRRHINENRTRKNKVTKTKRLPERQAVFLRLFLFGSDVKCLEKSAAHSKGRKNEERNEKRNEKRSGKRNRERSRKQIKKEAEKRLGEKIWIQERYWKK